jgi:hypothetical protein
MTGLDHYPLTAATPDQQFAAGLAGREVLLSRRIIRTIAGAVRLILLILFRGLMAARMFGGTVRTLFPAGRTTWAAATARLLCGGRRGVCWLDLLLGASAFQARSARQ